MPTQASSPFVIVGAGLAGAKAAQALRTEGFEGPVVLIGAEPHHPYDRPPLSKEYLQGDAERSTLDVLPKDWYAENDVDLRVGTEVSAIDPVEHRVSLTNGQDLGYAKLLLATGSTPRLLPVPGADLDGVLYLRTVDDSDAIREAFSSASRVAIIGAGWIGLETAAVARAAGVETTVLETSELPLLRVLGPELAKVFAELHREHGVDLRCGVQVAEITGPAGRANGVRLADGTHIEADAVLVGVGITPNTQLAQATGLEVDNGIQVDASLRTSNPDIYAAGDVANAFHPLLGKHIRLEHWASALYQPRIAVASMLGREVAFDRLPYFYTDQYDLGMEYTGYVEPDGYDRVVIRGDLEARKFIAFWLRDDRVLAGMNVNVWKVTKAIQTLVRSGEPIDPDRLADPDTPLDAAWRR